MASLGLNSRKGQPVQASGGEGRAPLQPAGGLPPAAVAVEADPVAGSCLSPGRGVPRMPRVAVPDEVVLGDPQLQLVAGLG